MLSLKFCPVCGSELQLVNGAYTCNNESCSVVILDNHILSLDSIVNMFRDTTEKLEVDTKSEDKHMKVCVMNQTNAEAYAMQKHDVASVVVSITSRCSHEAFIVPNNISNIRDVLKVQFNDEDTEDKNFGSIEYTDAKQISDFIKKYKDNSEIDLIIVHCEAGQSRSAGVAAAILKYLYDDDTQIFNDKRYTPNMLCYRKVLTALMYDE